MDIMQEFAKIKKEYGDWTAHPIELPGNICTMEEFNENHLLYLYKIIQIAKDILGGSLNGRRVLDLGCLEGGFAIEFALNKADVVAVEGRKSNLAKLDFAVRALQLSNIRTILSDVRDISVEEHGEFDCVLCLGLLYHLNKDSIGDFLKKLYQMTSHVLILDTHISLYGGEQAVIDGISYDGATYIEHNEADTSAEIQSKSWASLNNKDSFFLTFASLLNLLKQAGFTSIYVCEMPYYNIMSDRKTIVAIKGDPCQLASFNQYLLKSGVYPEKSPFRAIEPVNKMRSDNVPRMFQHEPPSLRGVIALFFNWIRYRVNKSLIKSDKNQDLF